MDISTLQEEEEHARVFRRDEADREREMEAGFSGRSRTAQIPRGQTEAVPSAAVAGFSRADLAVLKEEYPFLAKFSDAFLSSQTLDTLLQLESTKIKMQKMEESKKSGDRLGSNKAKLSTVFIEVSAGRDNRSTELHEARFLPGAGVSVTKQWLEARKVLGQKSLVPLGCYDMASLGLDGLVASKGWVEIHDPGSMNLSVQMFNINSVTAKDGGMSDIAELRLALRTMRAACGLVMPWNKSIEALENFLLQSNFCFEETGKLDKRAKLMSQFVDQVLRANAVRWRDEEPFLTAGRLQSTWASFISTRSSATSVNKKQDNTGQKRLTGGIYFSKELLDATGACARYNNNMCSDQSKRECRRGNLQLKHICLHVADKSKPLVICGKDHPNKFHK
jgi:hypothetical protein